jgi:hypothetical protein
MGITFSAIFTYAGMLENRNFGILGSKIGTGGLLGYKMKQILLDSKTHYSIITSFHYSKFKK